MKTNKIEFTVNFGGFYGSVHEFVIDNYAECMEFTEAQYDKIDWKACFKSYPNDWLDLLEGVLHYDIEVNFDFLELVSPKYYNYSTDDFYFQGHYEHQFRPLKENGKSKFQPTAGINYLYTGSAGNYVELGVGMDKIFKFWRMDFYNSWREGNHDSFGVRVGATIF
jgi:hypothetical protein